MTQRCIQPAIYETTCDVCQKVVDRDGATPDVRRHKVRLTLGVESSDHDLCADCFAAVAALIPHV